MDVEATSHALDFWTVHGRAGGVFLLAGLVLLPRCALLLVGAPFGVLHWLGWFLWPQLVIAVVATYTYGERNPFLVASAWVWVLVKLVTAAGAANEASA